MRVPVTGWAAVSVAVVLVGCAAQESDPSGDPTPTPPTLTAPASPSPMVEEAALDAYRGMWAVVVEGSHEGAVGHPDLDEYTSGQALELTTAMLHGAVATGEPEMAPDVVDSDLTESPATVTVEDCIDDSAWSVEVENGGTEGGPRLVTATVVADNGRWRVDDLWLEDYGSC
ncbi:hypothetical protein BJF83_20045 [Nocardiopsis sp. CNR-923]|uniref:hypothetical protein n=1 Tax=Nocardiopsis sp. CNR-923 TaxID=1904965 RepID=UPI000963B90F|nr:hypothetical protein [Nocardiopsis sp. CNR-923]OLT26895.1 hypothetical protein BJF83_20045 [Nocardiopsis sp. CNR-923]